MSALVINPVDMLRNSLRQARLDRYEVAGSLGDLGTFLPLVLGMATQTGLDLSTAIFFAGRFNIVTGLTSPSRRRCSR
jgi:hypothetical protein